MKLNSQSNYLSSEIDMELKNKFRHIWNMGPNGAYEGIVIFNNVINLLQQVNTSLSVKEIIKWFYIENADLIGLSIGKLVFYLDQENKVLYNRKR